VVDDVDDLFTLNHVPVLAVAGSALEVDESADDTAPESIVGFLSLPACAAVLLLPPKEGEARFIVTAARAIFESPPVRRVEKRSLR